MVVFCTETSIMESVVLAKEMNDWESSVKECIKDFNNIEKLDVLSDILDISIGAFVNNDLLLGITNEKSYADYIKNYHNPVQDSLFVSDFQFLVKYYFNKYFLLLKTPISSNVDDISPFDNARFGAGYIFLSQTTLYLLLFAGIVQLYFLGRLWNK